MSIGDVLWCVLMGFVCVWAADLFGLWVKWQNDIEQWWRARQ